MTTNLDVYSTSEEGLSWQSRAGHGLYNFEEYLLKKYLTDKNARVIEAGCGSGRISFLLSDWGFKNIDAFDYSKEMIRKAHQFQSKRNSGREI